MWIYHNPNPCRSEEPDCVVRAIATATGQNWDAVHADLCEMSRDRCTMPSVNWLWQAYLRQHGFTPFTPGDCPECATVRGFCRHHPHGTYILGTGSHVVAAVDGHYLDIWDCGDERPVLYMRK